MQGVNLADSAYHAGKQFVLPLTYVQAFSDFGWWVILWPLQQRALFICLPLQRAAQAILAAGWAARRAVLAVIAVDVLLLLQPNVSRSVRFHEQDHSALVTAAPVYRTRNPI